MAKLSRKALFLEKKLVICCTLEQSFNYLYLLKRLLKVQKKKHHKFVFLVERQNRSTFEQDARKAAEYNFLLNAGGNPNIHNQKHSIGTDWQHSQEEKIQVTSFLHFSLIPGMDCFTLPQGCLNSGTDSVSLWSREYLFIMD